MRFEPIWIKNKWQGFSEMISEYVALPKCYEKIRSGKTLSILSYCVDFDAKKVMQTLNSFSINVRFIIAEQEKPLSVIYDAVLADANTVHSLYEKCGDKEYISLQRTEPTKGVAYVDTDLILEHENRREILTDAIIELFLRLQENEENRLSWTEFQRIPDFEEVGFHDLPAHIKAGYILTEVNHQKRKTFCFSGVPNRDEKSVHPAVVLVHGAGGNAFYRWVDEWTKRGYVAISIDINCTKFENKDLIYRVKNPDAGELNIAGFPHIYKDPKDSWIYYSVSQIISANSFIRSMPFVDATRVGLVGISWGGVVSLIALSEDARFALGSIIYSAGFITEDKLGEETGIFEDYGKKRFYDSFYDARNYVKNISTPILFHAGLQDGAFTPFSRQRCCDLMKNEQHFALTKELYHDNESNFVNENVLSFFDDFCLGYKKRANVEFTHKDGDILVCATNQSIQRFVLCYVDEAYIPHKTPWFEVEGETHGNSGTIKIPEQATAYVGVVYYGSGLYTSSKLYRRNKS